MRVTHTLTEGLLDRYFQGVNGDRDAALLDVVRDFALQTRALPAHRGSQARGGRVAWSNRPSSDGASARRDVPAGRYGAQATTGNEGEGAGLD